MVQGLPSMIQSLGLHSYHFIRQDIMVHACIIRMERHKNQKFNVLSCTVNSRCAWATCNTIFKKGVWNVSQLKALCVITETQLKSWEDGLVGRMPARTPWGHGKSHCVILVLRLRKGMRRGRWILRWDGEGHGDRWIPGAHRPSSLATRCNGCSVRDCLTN